MFASVESLGQINEVTAPSGQVVSLTTDEEREIVKQAISDKIKLNLTMPVTITQGVVHAVGTAIGIALGGILTGHVLGWRR